MSLLLAFESSARHQSFTRAAEELSLSQSAVSRHVQNLEELLEITLFQRQGRKIKLTDTGAAYLKEVSVGLSKIRSATLQAISYRHGGGSLHLAVLPSVGSKWLLPRIHRFYERHPGIQVHIHSRIGEFDLELAGIDVAISNSVDGHWPGAVAHKLMEEELVPVISPALAATLKGRQPLDLTSQLLLQVAARPNVWGDWFLRQGLALNRMRVGPVFELTHHLLQAVQADIGIGLVARFLVEKELQTGQLLEACEGASSHGIDYFVFTAEQRLDFPPAKAFREWVQREVALGSEAPAASPQVSG